MVIIMVIIINLEYEIRIWTFFETLFYVKRI